LLIGLISDTHGLFRPSITAAFAGVDLILHAGDVGGPRVMQQLRLIAPVHAVRGNVDDPANPDLVDHVSLAAGTQTVHVSHGHELGSPNPALLLRRYAADIIVYGHTHRPIIHRDGGRLVVNPGAAGPRRFNLLPSVARLVITEHHDADAEIVWLDPS
jgi:putative phosphoesterase